MSLALTQNCHTDAKPFLSGASVVFRLAVPEGRSSVEAVEVQLTAGVHFVNLHFGR
jgi:hypothetical protein